MVGSFFPNRLAGYFSSVLGIAAITATCAAFPERFPAAPAALAMLLLVLLLGAGWGRRPAMLTATLGAFCIYYLSLPPAGGLLIRDTESWSVTAIFLITALSATKLSTRTGRRVTEAELTILNKAQEIARIGSWHLDVPRNQLTWSEEVFRIFRIPRGAALTYEAFLATVHPEDREYVAAAWSAALRGAPYVRHEQYEARAQWGGHDRNSRRR